MPADLYKTQAGEVRRGLIFHESFKDAVSVAANGATVTGSVSISNGADLRVAGKNLQYFNVRSANTKLTLIARGDWTFTSGSPQYIVQGLNGPDSAFVLGIGNDASTSAKTLFYEDVTNGVEVSTTTTSSGEHTFAVVLDGTSLIFYVDGVKLGNTVTVTSVSLASDALFIGTDSAGADPSLSIIKEVKIFNDALSATEIANEYANSTTQFIQTAYALWLFNERTFDPTNNRVLDISGNSRHLTRGDGSTTTTFPTKLVRSGFSLDGGDYFRNTTLSSFPSTAGTIIFRTVTTGTGTQILMIVGETASKNSLYYVYDSVSAGRVVVYNSSSSFTNAINKGIGIGATRTIGISYDASNIYLYLDGQLSTSAARPANVDLSAVVSLYLGQSSAGAFFQTGSIFGAGIWSSALTPLQHALAHEYFKANETST